MAVSSNGSPVGATIGKLVLAMLAAGVLAAGLLLPYVGGIGLAAGHEADKFLNTTCFLVESKPPLPSNIYANDGKTLIARVFEQDRIPVALEKVPKVLQEALVATEDRRFYEHHGVDMRGLIRSAVSTSGGDTQGGSTLTMQYVKQIRYYQAGRDQAKQEAAVAQNLNRKIEDAKCALQFEKKESKAQILENYLNIAFFGENSYGVEVAAQNFFGKDVKDLTLPESALLVGMLRAPSDYDPFINPAAAKQRRNEVIQNLVDVGKLDQAAADKYEATPVALSTKGQPPVREGCANSGSTIPNVGFFCDYVIDWLKNAGITDTQLDTGGLKIVTTLDPKVQQSTQKGITDAVSPTSPMAAVLPVIDPRHGEILAMATSKQYGIQSNAKDNTHTTLNLFTRYTAEGSSTYKLFALLAALNTGIPADLKMEQPANNGPYQPKNCATDSPVHNDDSPAFIDRNETLQSATVKSSNTYFVGLVDQGFSCDLQPLLNLAKAMGLKGLQQPGSQPKVNVAQEITNYQQAARLVLGAVPTSPLELAGAYAAVANGGVFNPPTPVLTIIDSAGQAVAVKREAQRRVLQPQIAAQAVQILKGDTTSGGTSAPAFTSWYSGSNKSEVAGKTGTSVAVVTDSHGKLIDSDQNASLWFVGMTPNLVATSALVNFDHPHAPAAGLKGLSDPGHQAYGEYASQVWLSALSDTISADTWTWPDPDSVDGTDVPDIKGLSLSDAKAKLAAAGFGMTKPDPAGDIYCQSNEPYGTVGYYGPQKAEEGTLITVCPSNGHAPEVYTPPAPKPAPHPPATKPKPKPTATRRSTGTTTGGTTGGTTTTKPGHGHHGNG